MSVAKSADCESDAFDDLHKSYEPTVEFPGGKWRKFLPTDLPSPWWYDARALEVLVFSHVAAASSGERDLTLREFVVQFRGLSRADKAKAVCALLPQIKRLSDFDIHADLVPTLLEAMRTHADAPKPDVLGLVGKDHFRQRFEEMYGVKHFWYQKVKDVIDGIPFVFEVALAETEVPGDLFAGVNFSPTFEDPFAGTRFTCDDFASVGVRGFLESGHAAPGPSYYRTEPRRTAAAVHLVSPSLTFLDRGKTRLDIGYRMAVSIQEALWDATKALYKEGEREKKDAARAARRRQQMERDTTIPEPTLKSAVFHVLPEAVSLATGDGQYPVSARSLFYQVRPLAQVFTSKPLEYIYFSQTLLIDYQLEHGRIQGLYYDPRGVLYEPHSDKSVPLGTREVEGYEFPTWKFNKILYTEKKGLYPVLQAARLGERYDMAVVAGEGYGTEAARTIFSRAEKGHEYRLFVLHDADPDGYMIARKMGEETHRMQGYSVNVVDLGLSVDDAVSMGLSPETFTRKKALAGDLELATDLEREFFEGRKIGYPNQWACRRIELNALTAPQLVAYIERKLEEADATDKVVPPKRELTQLAQDTARELLLDWARTEYLSRVNLNAIVNALYADAYGAMEEFTPDGVRAGLEASEFQRRHNWRSLVERDVGEVFRGKRDKLLPKLLKELWNAVE